MKISYDILKTFVTPPADITARELAETLTMRTVEVEGYTDFAQRLDGVVIGLVKKVRPHPNADKLKLAEIDIGKKSFEVVCGGVNLREGMQVAFAQVGALVRWHGESDWEPLAKASIRGVTSDGMACAAEELDIPDPAAVPHGIMDLSPLKAVPGTPLAEALGLDDIIFEIDNKSITHRPDLWGHLGLARELAAIWQAPFKMPALAPVVGVSDIPLKVSIKAPEHCRRYLGLVVAGLKVGESPSWLKQKLTNLGMRPINNVVDVTNYVMLELGQPMHAFDLGKFAQPEIVVRLAERGEKLMTLDGETRTLGADMLVIADSKQVVAVAGVMGGQGSEVSNTTTAIVLESATFDPVSVRQTASALGLRTDASMRFEKGLDPALAELALKRAVELLGEVCSGARSLSLAVDDYPRPLEPVKLSLNLPWLTRRLGCEVPRTEVVGILSRLGFAVAGTGDELAIEVPSWRATRDITMPEDLIEEVARIYGYDKIPLTMPKFEITPPAVDETQALRWKIRDLLVGAGWTETLSYSFVGSRGELELDNPVDKTKQYLRSSLRSSFEEQFVAARRAGHSVKLFELGRIFTHHKGQFPVADKGTALLPHQPWHLVLGVYESGSDGFRLVKGVVDAIQRQTGQELTAEYQAVGADGVMAELTLDGLSIAATSAYQPIPKYPSVSRDFSIMVSSSIAWAEIEEAVRKISPLIESIEVFDIYHAKGSIAFSLTFRHPERTLKSVEVDEVMVKITQVLQDKFNAIIR